MRFHFKWKSSYGTCHMVCNCVFAWMCRWPRVRPKEGMQLQGCQLCHIFSLIQGQMHSVTNCGALNIVMLPPTPYISDLIHLGKCSAIHREWLQSLCKSDVQPGWEPLFQCVYCFLGMGTFWGWRWDIAACPLRPTSGLHPSLTLNPDATRNPRSPASRLYEVFMTRLGDASSLQKRWCHLLHMSPLEPFAFT